MQIESLVQQLQEANAAYRSGDPILSDAEYDELTEELRELDADNPWLHQVEPEPEGVLGFGKVVHKNPMLSTEKAYSVEEVSAFVRRVESAAGSIGIPSEKLRYKVTAKLDGLAGYRNPLPGVEMATRGNGLQGEDISTSFERLQVIGDDIDGPGEIVMPDLFFKNVIEALGFKTARNFMVGLIGADTLKEHHIQTIQNKMGHFVPYRNLPAEVLDSQTLMSNLTAISTKIRAECQYKTDGVVIEVIDERVKELMGSTNHHHRWQMAYKTVGETAETTIIDVVWQTGMTGRVTPVIKVAPVELAGATIRRATAHNPSKLASMGVGKGATVTLVRSGEVIPKIVGVPHPVKAVVPDHCPSCGEPLEEDGKFIICVNPNCNAQAERSIIHFFKTLGTADGFGPKAAEKLVEAGFIRPLSILKMELSDLESAGFGKGDSQNLFHEIQRCLTSTVEDWRFLAAFGIQYLGRGDSRTLLKAIGGIDALRGITIPRIIEVDNFAEKTARSIYHGLLQVQPEMDAIRALGIPLAISKEDDGATPTTKTLDGLSLVFTGTFSVGRQVIEEEARKAGANVQSSVNKKTSALVVGDNVGAKKTQAAQNLGVSLWTEGDYRNKLG